MRNFQCYYFSELVEKSVEERQIQAALGAVRSVNNQLEMQVR